MQRLFSTFADGWPGRGLFLLRLVAGVVLVHFGTANVAESPVLMIPRVAGVLAGVLLLIGLWTPVAGIVSAMALIWITGSHYQSHAGDPWLPVTQATVSAALAMIGPGAWSVDARLFGRKHIDLPES